MLLVGKSMGRIDSRILAFASFLILALASFLRADFNTDMDSIDMIIPGLAPAQVAAAGLSNFARITAGAFGASIAVTLWENRTALHHAQLAEAINPYRPATQMALEAIRQQEMSQNKPWR
jgi:DHA2 family multidrug resistance protein